jgi:excinuclease UvrABC ATPase subunit
VSALWKAIKAAIFGVAEVPPCWRCEGHGCITIYSTSDEYAAPCPVCKGAAAYHAKVVRREGCLPVELTWTPEREAKERPA